MPKIAFSIPEITKNEPLGRTKIYQLINDGRLRARKLDGRTIILAEDYKACLESLPEYTRGASKDEGEVQNIEQHASTSEEAET